VEAVGDVNEVWTGDITYVPAKEGWLWGREWDISAAASGTLSGCPAKLVKSGV
jgi:hypothetical protein